ncbi:MAG: hypothetical protein ACK5LR_06380 [Mangrovibacterium sp.]
MKKKNVELLDVDFIGMQPSKLTKEEEKIISEFIRRQKEKKKKTFANKKELV